MKPKVDATDRHAQDAFLRSKGFRIASRPADTEPIWSRAGVHYFQSDLLRRLEPAPDEAAIPTADQAVS